MNTLQKHPNTAAATIVGAGTVIVEYIASRFGLELPETVAGAIVTVVTGLALLFPGPKVDTL